MRVRAASFIVSLIVATAPALAKDSTNRKPAAAAARGTAQAAAAVEPARGAHRRKGAAAVEKGARATEAGGLKTPEGDPFPTTVNFPAEAVGWQFVEDPATGARFGLPEKLVPHAGTTRTGSRWTSAQGQIQVETFRLAEAALPALFEEEKKAPRRHVTSSELKEDSFVMVGVQGLKNFLIRAQARGSELRGITILYDQATEGTMEYVAAAMVSTFAGFPDPNSAPLPGLRRAVEYGSAVVVDGTGDLIAPAPIADECQSITVTGFGHAERVATDKASDLALIRLYGARDLVAAPLASGGDPNGDIKLVGIADPLAQAGGADVTSVAAHLTAQGFEPVPPPGFSGAAAVDARGAVAGIVEIKPPVVVAGSGSANLAATLVPAAAIRAFLQAQHVTPAAPESHAPVEQSVVRIICVRK